MTYPFRNLVFEGGGVKGVAYIGALRELEKRGITKRIRRVGGTSAGAINALLLALGYTLAQTQKILETLDFNNFMDDSWGLFRDFDRLRTDYGWYKGDFFREWIGRLIRKKTGNEHSTFNDLSNRGFLDLYLVGTNLSTGFSEVFSPLHTPRTCVADAARISMSIPLFFAAVRQSRGGAEDVYVDGGVFENYPIKLFDREKYIEPADQPAHARQTNYYEEENRNKPATSSPYVYNRETLGFRLDSRKEIAVFRDRAEPLRHQIDDFFDYALRLVQSLLNVQNNQHLHSDDWQRTVYIDTIGVGTTDFDLSTARKRALIAEGAKGVREYFEWYETAKGKAAPVNRPPGQRTRS